MMRKACTKALSMNRDLLDIAHRLQEKLNGIDADADRASLIWAHGFLTGLLASLASRIPDLAGSRLEEKKPEGQMARRISQLQKETSRTLDSLDRSKPYQKDQKIRELSRRALKKLREMKLMSDEPDSLERLLDDLDESGPAETSGVPANRKPGPKGLSGGVALPLPTDTDYKM
jgi:hypothetical protein